jgi:NTP pyrophosphatase (non-canonical NTP hydrolase)
METDRNICIQELKDRIKEFIKERDWEKYHHPKEIAISMAIEIAELLEVFQWEEKRSVEDLKREKKTLEKIREEIADVLIYAMSISNQLDIDISEAIIDKLEKNRRKYPHRKVIKEGLYKKDIYNPQNSSY